MWHTESGRVLLLRDHLSHHLKQLCVNRAFNDRRIGYLHVFDAEQSIPLPAILRGLNGLNQDGFQDSAERRLW